MQYEFDPTKDHANQEKHGLSLGLATALDWDSLVSIADTRREIGEAREVGYAMMGVRLYCVVFVQRGNVCRVISLRRANDREKVLYAKLFNAS